MFWILAVHRLQTIRPQTLMVARHDSGTIVFNLEREQPAAADGQGVYYARDREFFCHKF